MYRILSFGLAVVATIGLSQSVYAKDKGGHGGGGKAGGGSKAQSAAPAKMPHAMRAPSMPHIAKEARPQFKGPAVVAKSGPTRKSMPLVAQGRTFTEPKGHAPSIAFGGTAPNNNNAAMNARNARTFSTTGPAGTTRSAFAFRPPTDVSHGWDRGRVQEWNRHHYRWSGTDWVIVDGGFYGYPYDTEQPYFNYYSAPGYSNATSSESLVASVQSQLSVLGYNPGPADGVIGAQTQDAIASFQSDRHLPVTGQIDTPTLQALGL